MSDHPPRLSHPGAPCRVTACLRSRRILLRNRCAWVLGYKNEVGQSTRGTQTSGQVTERVFESNEEARSSLALLPHATRRAPQSVHTSLPRTPKQLADGVARRYCPARGCRAHHTLQSTAKAGCSPHHTTKPCRNGCARKVAVLTRSSKSQQKNKEETEKPMAATKTHNHESNKIAHICPPVSPPATTARVPTNKKQSLSRQPDDGTVSGRPSPQIQQRTLVSSMATIHHPKIRARSPASGLAQAMLPIHDAHHP